MPYYVHVMYFTPYYDHVSMNLTTHVQFHAHESTRALTKIKFVAGMDCFDLLPYIVMIKIYMEHM